MSIKLSTNQLKNLKSQDVENSFILFKADWCPFCIAFMPVYEELEKVFKTKKMKNGKHIRFFVYDCTDSENAKFAAENCDIEGYPTLKWIDENKEMVDYPGGRDKNDIIRYVCKEKNVCIDGNFQGQKGGKLGHKDLKMIFRTSKVGKRT